MRIAYHLLLHKNREQALHLLNTIWSPEDVYLVHVDKKTPDDYAADLIEHIRIKGWGENVFLQERRTINWGAPALMKHYYRGICTLLEIDGGWDYYINLSGQDFPLEHIASMKHKLRKDLSRNYVEVRSRKEWPLLDKRLGWYYLSLAGKPYCTGIPRRIPKDIEFYGGSAFCALTRDFCVHMTESPFTVRLLRHLQFSKIPDEIFFQTMIMASPFRETLVNDNHHFMIWSEINDGHPRVFTSRDIEALQESSKSFARKFDWHVDKSIIDKLADQLNQKEKESPRDDS